MSVNILNKLTLRSLKLNRKLRTSRVTRFLFGVEGELALKNLKRNRRRYRATVLSLLISIVLFVSFSSNASTSGLSIRG